MRLRGVGVGDQSLDIDVGLTIEAFYLNNEMYYLNKKMYT